MTTTPRRQILRSPRSAIEESTRLYKLTARRARLLQEQQSLSRWMARLRRAFHAVKKQLTQVKRLEREIAHLANG